jgi:hypothetical protein
MLCEQNVGRVLQEVAYKTFYRIMLAVDFWCGEIPWLGRSASWTGRVVNTIVHEMPEQVRFCAAACHMI